MKTKAKKSSTKAANKNAAMKASLKLGEIIREKRLAKGYSQAELAAKLGYESPQFVSDWERAYNPIPLPKLIQISKLLDMNADHLFEIFLDFSLERLSRDMKEEFRQLRKRKA